MPDLLTTPEDMDADEWLDWVAGLPAVSLEKHRNAVMIEGLKSGCTLQAVGDVFAVTRERVRQVAAAAGVRMSDLRAEQRAAHDRRQRRQARHVIGASLAHPEMTIGELAEWLDLDEETIRRHLGRRRTVHEPRTVERNKASAVDLVEALVQWGSHTTQFTGDDYTQWAKARGLPGKQTVAIRVGSWNAAMELAGLGEHIGERGGLRPVISDEELWASLIAFLSTDLPGYSFAVFESFARERGLGSGALVRQRLGGWSDALVEVREVMRYAADRDGSWPWAEAILDVTLGETPRNVVTRQDAVASLARVANLMAGPVTVQAYESCRAASDVQAALIQRRCGSWITALVEAGLAHRMSAKARGKVMSGEAQLPDAVRDAVLAAIT